MAMDKDDWGSGFGCDPDWHHKKIAQLERALKLLEQELERVKGKSQ